MQSGMHIRNLQIEGEVVVVIAVEAEVLVEAIIVEIEEAKVIEVVVEEEE